MDRTTYSNLQDLVGKHEALLQETAERLAGEAAAVRRNPRHQPHFDEAKIQMLELQAISGDNLAKAVAELLATEVRN